MADSDGLRQTERAGTSQDRPYGGTAWVRFALGTSEEVADLSPMVRSVKQPTLATYVVL